MEEPGKLGQGMELLEMQRNIIDPEISASKSWAQAYPMDQRSLGMLIQHLSKYHRYSRVVKMPRIYCAVEDGELIQSYVSFDFSQTTWMNIFSIATY